MTLSKRISMLEDMEDKFSVSTFEYDSTEKRILGMKYLLGTWEVLLDGISNLRTRDQYVIYRVITKILIRKEFLLVFFLIFCDLGDEWVFLLYDDSG